VPAEADPPPRKRRALHKGRMESFSDGVFAFAATLLVVDLALHPPGTALQQVVHAWPSFVAYIVSFLTIGTAWLAHTGLTDRLVRTDPLFLRLNLLLLLVVVFLPFPTRLIADARYHPPGTGVHHHVRAHASGHPRPGVCPGCVRQP
jgi:uncharacterized membrane protein